VQDAHNLAWKLSLVLKGEAPPSLLETYAAERQPVGWLSVEQAYTRYVLRTDPTLAPGGYQPIVQDLNIELGYVYRSPTIVSDLSDDGRVHISPRESCGRPGTRAPHLWLHRDGERVSSLDLYGQHFVLLAGPAGTEWCRCARTVASDLGAPLEVLRPGDAHLEDPTGGLCAAHGIQSDGCLLIRPDGFVGWRARDTHPISESILESALAQLLGRVRETATARNSSA
jgi:hypothetical protein